MPQKSKKPKRPATPTDDTVYNVPVLLPEPVEGLPLPDTAAKCDREIELIKAEITRIKGQLKAAEDDDETRVKEATEEEEVEWEDFQPPPHCIPLRTDVRDFDWDALASEVGNFDVITMDPPWQLASANPTRGVAIGYSTLPMHEIINIPLHKLQKDGFLFVWVINAFYQQTLDAFEQWGYELVDDITWVKATVNRRLAKSHGYYLQHAKESCLVAKKGKLPASFRGNISSDVINAPRTGQSQKPKEIYELVEQLVPGGKFLEVFGRRNNLRDYWFTVGNEL